MRKKKKKVQTHDKLNIGPSELPSSKSVSPSHLWPTGEINNRRMLRPVWSVRGSRKIINKKYPLLRSKSMAWWMALSLPSARVSDLFFSCVVCGHKTADVFSGSRRGRRTLCSHTPNQHFFFFFYATLLFLGRERLIRPQRRLKIHLCSCGGKKKKKVLAQRAPVSGSEFTCNPQHIRWKWPFRMSNDADDYIILRPNSDTWAQKGGINQATWILCFYVGPFSPTSPFRYSIDWKSDLDSYFDIDPVEGTISTNELLDRESIAQHNISIVATKLSKYDKTIGRWFVRRAVVLPPLP